MRQADEWGIDELITRHAAFWRREEAGGPLLAAGEHPLFSVPVEEVYGGWDGRALTPDDAGAERFLAALDLSPGVRQPRGDLFAALTPYPRIPWLEAICGARVVPQMASGSIWSDKPAESLTGHGRLVADEGWVGALLAQTDRLIEVAPPELPVCQTLMRGPGDVLEAVLGAETLLYAMMDGAGWLRPLIDSVVGIFVDVARAQWARIPPWHGGYVNFHGFWSPEPCVRLQEDVQRVLSVDLYREWLRPAHIRIIGEFPYSIFHIHSGTLHMAAEVAALPGLSALEIAIDQPPYAPPITDAIPLLRTLQERMPLFIEGPMTAEEYAALQRELPSAGLALRPDLY
jgi:hypothetical protein